LLLSLLELGGATKSVDTEDLAIKAHELLPSAFAWKKYPEQVNLELVRVNLSNFKKPSHGTLVRGSGREGWRFTEEGIRQAVLLKKSLVGSELGVGLGSAGSVDTVRHSRELKRLMTSQVYRDWVAGSDVSDAGITDLLKMNHYTPASIVEIKLVRLREVVTTRPELEPFIDFLRSRMEMIFDEQ